MSLATPIPLERLCQLALVSRAGFYRWRGALPATDADLDLHDEIQRIALEFPYYGWPRITAELGKRGWEANHKRVYRIMREDNLLCLRKRKFVVATTNSNHSRPVYPNLAREMTLTGINQLWVADYHAHPAGVGVRLSGGDSGRLLAARDWLGARPNTRRRTDYCSVADETASPAPGLSASFRQRRPVRFRRLHWSAEGHIRLRSA